MASTTDVVASASRELVRLAEQIPGLPAREHVETTATICSRRATVQRVELVAKTRSISPRDRWCASRARGGRASVRTAPAAGWRGQIRTHTARTAALGGGRGRRPLAEWSVIGQRSQERRDARVRATGRDAEEVLEVVEVDVHRPHRDAGPLGDLPGRRPQVALAQEVEQRVGDRVPGRGLACGPTFSDGAVVTSAQCTYSAHTLQYGRSWAVKSPRHRPDDARVSFL